LFGLFAFDASAVSDDHLPIILNHYQLFARETIFEEVRVNHFPNLPSRSTCLWVIPHNQQAIDYWEAALTQGGESQFVKLKLTGIIHKTNQPYLQINRNSMDYNRKSALEYWNGISGSGSIEDEYLFQGIAEVMEFTKTHTD
jgi:hypothetical protein